MLWLGSRKKERAVQDLTSPIDLKYWDSVYLEARLVRKRYHIPLRWAMLFSIISTMITSYANAGVDDVEDADY